MDASACREKIYDVFAESDEGVMARVERALGVGTERLRLPIGFVTRIEDDVQEIVAATGDDAEYLRGLDDDAALFETHEYDGEERERFDTDYPDHDGTTPVEGLYVASPSAESLQALVVAGRGARVGRQVIEDVRRARR